MNARRQLPVVKSLRNEKDVVSAPFIKTARECFSP